MTNIFCFIEHENELRLWTFREHINDIIYFLQTLNFHGTYYFKENINKFLFSNTKQWMADIVCVIWQFNNWQTLMQTFLEKVVLSKKLNGKCDQKFDKHF